MSAGAPIPSSFGRAIEAANPGLWADARTVVNNAKSCRGSVCATPTVVRLICDRAQELLTDARVWPEMLSRFNELAKNRGSAP
jgi:hypothetical protein